MSIADDDTLRRLVRRLHRIESDWPEGYWLFSGSGVLYLMKEKPEGRTTGIKGGMDQNDIVAKFNGIPNDGGDW